jgi:hypothetical protein
MLYNMYGLRPDQRDRIKASGGTVHQYHLPDNNVFFISPYQRNVMEIAFIINYLLSDRPWRLLPAALPCPVWARDILHFLS